MWSQKSTRSIGFVLGVRQRLLTLSCFISFIFNRPGIARGKDKMTGKGLLDCDDSLEGLLDCDDSLEGLLDCDDSHANF